MRTDNPGTQKKHRVLRRSRLSAAVVAASLLLAGGAYAGPKGGVVTGGDGSIAQSGTVTNVQQLTDRMSVQWQSFDVGRAETVNFLQPNNSSVVLNQILQNGPSQINGLINANGHVLLINPRGVIFGETSVINAGALTASTLWLERDDFLNGDLVLRALDDEKGVVVNSGLINAATGGVTLLGEAVQNEGLITAELGYVNLASGREAYLTFDDEGFLGVRITEEVADNLLGADSSVENSGTISAAGGKVILEANVSRDLFDTAVNNSGIIEATGFGDGAGGTVHVLGDTVALTASSRISVDGVSGGGEILVGGDYQGANPDVANAQFTTVEQGVELSANAMERGDGGKVIVWADDTTVYHGQISATGGLAGGDGGQAEVSGKLHLRVSGFADLRAPNGTAGSLLLDPGKVTIVDGDIDPGTLPDDTFTDVWIRAQLGSGDLTISTEANGDNPEPGTLPENIEFGALVDVEVPDARNLTFEAGEDILFSSDTAFTMATADSELVLRFGRDNNGATLDLAGALITGPLEGVLIEGRNGNDTILGASVYVVDGNGGGTIEMDDGDALTSGTLTFDDVENLTGTDQANSFTVLSGGTIENLTGGAAGDTFSIEAGGTAGDLSGEGGDDTFTINNAGTAGSLLGGEGNDSFNLLGGVFTDIAGGTTGGGAADSDTDTITGGSDYDIDGSYSGSVDTKSFDEIENLVGVDAGTTFDVGVLGVIGDLTGASGIDLFTVLADGVAGDLSGEGGNDTFTINNAGTAGRLLGGEGSDSFIVPGGAFTDIAGGTSGGGAVDSDTDTIIGGSGYDVDGSYSGEVDNRSFDEIENLVGVDGGTLFDVGAMGVIGNLTGAAGMDVFTVLAGGTAGDLSGEDGDDTFTINNAGTAGKLLGGEGGDTFNLLGGAFTDIAGGTSGGGTVDSDTDTITGGSDYDVDGFYAGTVDAKSFDEIENLVGVDAGTLFDVGALGVITSLTGAAGIDVFTVLAGGMAGELSGEGGDDTFTLGGSVTTNVPVIDGGSGTGDTVSYQDPVTLDLMAVSITLVEAVNANGAGSTLTNIASAGFIGPNAAVVSGTAYNLFAFIEGTANNDTFTLGAVDFLGTLRGLEGDDTFDLSGGGSAFKIEGGAGSADEITGGTAYVVANPQAGTVDLKPYDGIEELVAVATGSTFNVEALGEIGDLTGAAGVDSFTIKDGGMAGDLSGEGGNDIFTINETGTAGRLLGGAGSDTFNLLGGAFTDIVGGTSGGGAADTDTDTITGGSDYDVDGPYSGTVDSKSFDEIEDLVGVDTGATFDVTATGEIGDLVGGAGDDTFTVAVGSVVSAVVGGSASASVDVPDSASDTLLGAEAYRITGDYAGEAGNIGFTSSFMFSEIENLVGAAGLSNEFSFANDPANAGFAIDTLTANSLFSVFDFSGSGRAQEVRGSVGNVDQILGSNNYVFDAADGGVGSADGIIEFSEIEILTGGPGDDNFRIAYDGVASLQSTPLLQGLAGNDLFIVEIDPSDIPSMPFPGRSAGIEGGDDDDRVIFTPRIDLDLAAFPVTGVELVRAQVAGSTLAGAREYEFFEILDPDAPATTIVVAEATLTVGMGLTETARFNGFDEISGTSETDTFTLDGVRFTGELKGLGEDDEFRLLNGGTVGKISGGGHNLGDKISGGGTYVIGSDTESDGDNRGVVNEFGEFFEIEILEGSAGEDTFTLLANGTIDRLLGAAGDDVFNIFNAAPPPNQPFTSLDGGEHVEGDRVNYQVVVSLDVSVSGNPFDNIEILDATSLSAAGSRLSGARQYNFVANDQVQVGDATEINGDTTYIGFDILTGTDFADKFFLNTFAFPDGLIEGQSGADALSGADFLTVTSSFEGTLGAGDDTRFEGIENLIGTDTSDTFNLLAGGVISLSGEAGNDVFNVQDPGFEFPGGLDGGNGDDAVNYTTQVALDLGDLSFTNIEAVNALVGGSSLEQASLYTFISDTNVQADGNTDTTFVGFEILIGTAIDDVFDLNGNAFAGTIDGLGQGVGGDVVRGSMRFAVTGSNSGTVGTRGETTFTDIENLIGTVGDDTFDLTGQLFAGTLDGLDRGPLGDQVRGATQYNISGENSGTAGPGGQTVLSSIERLVGTTGDDVFAFTGAGSVEFVDGHTQGAAGDTLSGVGSATISGNGEGSASIAAAFTEIENLVGTALDDLFTFVGEGFIGTIDGLAGTDTVDYSAASPRDIEGGDLTNIERLIGGAGIVLRGMSWIIGGGVGDGVNDGTVDGREFIDFAQISGTDSDDTFAIDGGTIASIDGGGNGDAGDTLAGDTEYTVTGSGAGSGSSVGEFAGIENLEGTTGDDLFIFAGGSIVNIDGLNGGANGDALSGDTSYTVTGDGVGTSTGVTGQWQGIENLLGTAGADTFTLDDGAVIENLNGLGGDDSFFIGAATFASLDGGLGSGDAVSYTAVVDFNLAASPLSNVAIVNASAPGSQLRGARLFRLTSNNSLEADDSGVSYSGFDTLVGTEGDDVFDLGGFSFSGSIDGLGHPNADQIIIAQDADSAQTIGIFVDGDSGGISFGLGGQAFESAELADFELQFTRIEDFNFDLRSDLNIKGSGILSSTQPILIGGSLNMFGPGVSDVALTLLADQGVTIDADLRLEGNADIEVVQADSVISVGRGVVIDAAGGAEINGFLVVNITEEPVLQLQVEEANSLSVFGDIDIFSAGRSSVAREDDDEIGSESELIDFLSGPGL